MIDQQNEEINGLKTSHANLKTSHANLTTSHDDLLKRVIILEGLVKLVD